MRFYLILAAALLAMSCTSSDKDAASGLEETAGLTAANSARNAPEILRSFAEAWKGASEFQLQKDTILGIWVDEIGYTVRLTNDGGQFIETPPEQFDWGFETDLSTLRQLDSERLNALTAMGQARATDPIPLDIRLPDSFPGNADVRGYFIPLTFHFWNREWPEVIRFGDGLTRFVHGGNTSVLIYDKGLRTAWYQLKPGMHINSEPEDQLNDFDTAIIVTKGSFTGKIDGEERTLRSGETVLIPAGISHEFFAGDNEYGEFLILMWGDEA